jgi:hypothetical protein
MKKTLYVNGDSHVAGAYQNEMYQPNISFAGVLAEKFQLNYVNEALAGGSNNRIIRTSKKYLEKADPETTLVFIAWSTFERTEWFFQNEWHQISGQPLYQPTHRQKLNKLWKDYTDAFWNDTNEKSSIFYLSRSIEFQYYIKEFSEWLSKRKFKHLFCHSHSSFFYKPSGFEIKWDNNVWLFDDPYNNSITFCSKSVESGYKPDEHWHFNRDAHSHYAIYIEKEIEKFLSS